MIVVGCLNVISSSSDTFNWGDLLIWLLEGPLAISFCGFILQLRRNKTVHTQQFFDGSAILLSGCMRLVAKSVAAAVDFAADNSRHC